MADPRFTDSDRLRELTDVRATYVSQYVERRINHRDGDCTNADIERWERQAYETWRNQYPALSSMFPSHLPSEVSA